MKKLLILSFMLFSLNVKAANTWHTIPTEDLDFDFFKGKVKELLYDIVTIATMFDEKIIENKDESEFEEMPTAKTKKAFTAAINDKKQDFYKYSWYFINHIQDGNQNYRDFNVLLFGPFDMIEHYMGYMGSLDTTLKYHVLTTAKPRGEIALPRKDRKPIKSPGDLIEYKKVGKIVKTLTQEVIKETLETGIGKVLK